MKKLINISLLFVFTLVFIACEKEMIKPVCEEGNHIDSFESNDDNDSFTRAFGRDIVIVDNDGVTDPDEEEDFDEDDSVTDPDEEEDFDEKESVTDPDEEEDFDEEDTAL